MPQVVQTKVKPMWLLYEHLLLGQDVQRDEYECWTVANRRRLSSTRERAQALQSQGDTSVVTCDLRFVALHWPCFSILNVTLYCSQIPICRERVDLCKVKPQHSWQDSSWYALSLQIWSGENVWTAPHKISNFQMLFCPAPNLVMPSFHSPHKTATGASCNTAHLLFWALWIETLWKIATILRSTTCVSCGLGG